MLLDSMSLTETTPLILDGKWVRDQILAELKPRVEKLTAAHRWLVRCGGVAHVLCAAAQFFEFLRNEAKIRDRRVRDIRSENNSRAKGCER